MKKDVAEYVGHCYTCQQVKAEHQRPTELLQPLPVSEWKWYHITMDFVSSLSRTSRGHNVVWVVVNRLTKSANFLAMKTTDSLSALSWLYVAEIVSLHGVPLLVVLDRDLCFVSNFWRGFQEAMGTQLNFSTTFHPQTNSQSKRAIQILEDMLRDFILDFGGNWSDYLPLAEFTYNNSF